MKTPKTKIFATLAVLGVLAAQICAAEVSLESAPPVVVKTFPVAGATDVDPALTEIRVTYSKAMQDGSWSWSTWGEESFPEMAGEPKYLADNRTCVLPVKLEPRKFYAIWLNSDRFKNFKDSGGRPAVPYLLTFFTGNGGGTAAQAGAGGGAFASAGGPLDWLREAGIDLDKVPADTAPYVQVMIEDVQPDGNSRFRSVIRSFNRGHEPQEKMQFMNSDHIELQRIVDAHGNNIPFTSVHRDRTFRYSATLPQPVPPGGVLIHGSEGVARNKVSQDPDLGTFAYRFAHSPGSSVATRRVEVHRLPLGAEVIEVSPNASQRERNGRKEIVLDQIVQPRGNVTLAYRYRLSASKKDNVATAVNEAVTIVSQCAEGDPRVAKALETLRPFEPAHVVSALLPHLQSSADTTRRAAIYILWKGELPDISRAQSSLERLLKHPEDVTRGMAALTLGGKRVAGSLEPLSAMLQQDQSGYARRCAAYALGLLGDARAEPLLKTALNDPESMVRKNAQAALDLLKAGASGRQSSGFGPVTEAVLKSPEGRKAELLDIDTGNRAASTVFGENDRETHAWVRQNKLDLLGAVKGGQHAVLAMDMVAAPAPENSFDAITAEQVHTNWHLGQGEPRPVNALVPAQEKTDTFYFKTREGGRGLLQIVDRSDDSDGVKVRYKLLDQASAGDGDAGRADGPSSAFLPALNDDQRAVVEWTDRQFGSFFDQRTFDGWSDAERATLETKLIDALKGPRSTEYYQAINTLAAIGSNKALPRLREIASERVDRNNRDRWMAIRALGIMGDKDSVPDLIHLVYHGNMNTRWWAQISLVRITGKNFGKDWNAWGQWWNAQNGQPPFKPEIIRWWNGQAEPNKLAESLEEGDRKFLESLRGKSAAAPAPVSSTELAARLRTAAPLMDGIRHSWASAVEAIQREDTSNAISSLRNLAPRIQEFRDTVKGTALEAGTAEALERLKPLMTALEKGDFDEARTAMQTIGALGQKMEEQVKAVTEASPVPAPEPVSGLANAVVLQRDDGIQKGVQSIGASGHAVEFERAGETRYEARYVEAVQIFASRYGTPEPPQDDFHLCLLNEQRQVLAELKFPYSLIERGEPKWYTLRTPSIEVPEKFMVALNFNPHQTKGVYLAYSAIIGTACHSLIGLPGDGFEMWKPVEWMVRVNLTAAPTKAKGFQSLADWKPPVANNPLANCRVVSFGGDKSEGQQSYGGQGPAIRFEPSGSLPGVPTSAPIALKGIRLYASRYGSGYAPEETKLHVIVRDAKDATLAEAHFPYAKFGYKADWVELVFDQPVRIQNPDEPVTIVFNPEATRYKGVYFHYQKDPPTSHSLAGTIAGGFKELPDREWMVRACFD